MEAVIFLYQKKKTKKSPSMPREEDREDSVEKEFRSPDDSDLILDTYESSGEWQKRIFQKKLNSIRG